MLQASLPAARIARLLAGLAWTVVAAAAADGFASPIAQADLDAGAFAEWVDGKEIAIGPDRRREGPAWLVWTSDSQAGWYGQEFGDSKVPGPRHLRIGFNRPVAVGTILACAESLSVLKPGAAYPGDLGDDGQWLPAQRVGREALTTTAAPEEIATWILPPGTTTRAIRATHVARQNDRRYVGRVGALRLLAERYDNLAVLATATASGNSEAATRVVDGRDNGTFDGWENGEHGQEAPVSPEHPAWVTLAWQQPHALSGVVLINVGAGQAEIQVCTAPADQHPSRADESAWKTIVPATAVDPMYPRTLPLCPLPFPATMTTRGVRVRLVQPFDDVHCHGHIAGRSVGGKRVWLTEVVALSPLGDRPLAAPTVARRDDHPPIPIRFHLAKPGLVTLVIEDADGNRVRNLVSETRFPAGDQVAWWDGLDDHDRDFAAADHHVYRIPGKLVAPATYRVRGLVRDDVSLTYEASFYTHGTPAWETADGSGGWLANHTPPQSCAFVPAGMTKDGQEWMLLGSPITEGGSGLAWVDLDGRKHHGQGWIGGTWTGAAHLAVDRGAKRSAGFYAYTASAAEGELRLSGLKPEGGDAPIVHWRFPKGDIGECGGVAVRDGVIVASLPKLGALLLVQVDGNRVLAQVPCADPRGVAFDGQGRLWVLSGTRLLRAALPADLIARCAGAPLDRAGWKASASAGDAGGAIDGKDDVRWDTHRPQQVGDWFQLDLGARQKVGRITLDQPHSSGDFARGLEVYASDDGATWGKPILSARGVPGSVDLLLPPTEARYLKLVMTAADAGCWWSIDELRVFAPAAGYHDLAAKPVVEKLEDPFGICIEGKHVYVSDRGASHQVKVFTLDGGAERVIGKPGRPTVGPYDPDHLNNPAGMAVDSRGRLWVAESDHQPKRVSVWKPDGSLDRAFYGPARYGFGGTIDPADRSRLFFEGMEFTVDPATGGDAVKNVVWRGGLEMGGQPERVEHVQGREYLTSSYTSNPTNAGGVVGIWSLDRGVAKPIAAAGRAQQWPPVADRFARLERFSVRWTGKVLPAVTGTTTFSTVSDDGVRLWVDGKPLIDNWTGHGATEDTGTIALTAGKPVDIRLEWYQGGGGATMHLAWSADGLPKAIIPADHLIPPGQSKPGGLRGEYHQDGNLDHPRFTRVDPTIDLDPPGGVLAIPGAEDAAAAFIARLPAGTQFDRDPLLFAWSDRDHDGAVDADEVTFRRDEVGGVTIQPDLAIATSTALVAKPSGFDAAGVPLYDLAAATAAAPDGRPPSTSGGGDTLVCGDGWTVLTIPPAPYPQQSSLSGAKDGVVRWTYPSLWPGLHPSHSAPVPDQPGMLIGTTRVLGPAFKPAGTDAWCWAINGNHGCVYVLTGDGLFVATLFRDARTASTWAMPVAQRGMHLEDTSLGEENFWPTLTQTADGRVHLVSCSCIVAVDGLETIRRIPAFDLAVDAAELAKAAGWTLEQEAKRQQEQGSGTLKVAITAKPPTVDGALDEWTGTDWATIDRRTVTVGDWGAKLDLVAGAVAVSGDRLYAAWRNADADLLRNAGTTWQTLFKFGGCLDLMVGADAKADPDRAQPVAGDRRLLVTRVDGKLVAVLYRPVVPGHTGERFAFTSPVSSLQMDEVARVDDQVQLANHDGDYELSVPLALLGLEPAAGQSIKADIGILRGNGFQTMQRCYWSNKATSMTADVPSEAQLTPRLWGRWLFEPR